MDAVQLELPLRRKFKVRVTEEVHATYDTADIEADNEDEAREIAEEMRVQGTLGPAQEDVLDVDISIKERG